jgi:glyoxalase family protein
LDGRASLDFEDAEGHRLRLVHDGGTGVAHPWDRSPVPVDHQIRGLGPITISVTNFNDTETMLTRVLNMQQNRDYASPRVGRLPSCTSRCSQIFP